MKKIGFITCKEFQNLYYDDHYLLELFEQSGLTIVPVIWNEPIPYDDFDVLLFRSAWDYHQKTAQFKAWLDELKHIKTPIYNPICIIEQNFDKYYLKDLQDKGFSIIPTLFFDTVNTINLPKLLQENGWQKGVIKPAVSMSAYQTYVFDTNNCQQLQQELIANYGNTKVMVQRFAKEIIEEGEWSLVFFDKKYCISCLKSPKQGDFRVQSDFGGTKTYPEPPQHIITEAQAVLESYDQEILYARVDGIIHQGHFQLMEVELIDPELYFKSGKKVRKAFLEAVKSRL